MKRINVGLAELQAFACLAEVRSFRAAAEQLGLTGSAVSRAIARIEDRLGARLFDRDTRNVTLTPQGLALQQLTRRILAEAQSALTEFDAYLSARSGRVTLAGLPSIAASFLPGLIARFAASHPEVEVAIIDDLSDGVIRAVLDGQADLGFTAGAVDGGGRLSFRPLLTDEFVAVGSEGGPLDGAPSWRWQDFADAPFVAMTPGSSVRALTDAAFAQAGSPVRPRFEVAHLVTAGALVAAGLGLAALPGLTLPVLGRGPFVTRDLAEPRMVRRIGVVQATGRTLSPAARAFYRDMLAAGSVALPSDGNRNSRPILTR